MISLRKALEMMRAKDERNRFVPFSLKFVSVEIGEFVLYNNVTLPQRERIELESEKLRIKSGAQPKKNQYKTTVKFRTDGDEFRQAHIHLITRFNGEAVS